MTKSFLTKCLTCKKEYRSYGALIDFGNCDSCNFNESIDLIKNWRRKPDATNKKVRPDYLGKDLLQKIRIYFCENCYVLWHRKTDCRPFINAHFNLNLSRKQVESIVNTNTLKCNNVSIKNQRGSNVK